MALDWNIFITYYTIVFEQKGVEHTLGWSFHNTSDNFQEPHTDAGFSQITLIPA